MIEISQTSRGRPGGKKATDLAEHLGNLWTRDEVPLVAKDVASGIVAESRVGETEGHISLERHRTCCLSCERAKTIVSEDEKERRTGE
jgi:hypothetical protein